MPKVFAIHEVELRPGVEALDYERFARNEVMALPWPQDVQVCLFKGIRGRREGRYLLAFTFPSLEVYNAFCAPDGTPREERRQWMQAHASVFEQADRLAERAYTDYVAVAE